MESSAGGLSRKTAVAFSGGGATPSLRYKILLLLLLLLLLPPLPLLTYFLCYYCCSCNYYHCYYYYYNEHYYYTKSPLQDSRLFGPRPWKILATTDEQMGSWATQTLAKILWGGILLWRPGVCVLNGLSKFWESNSTSWYMSCSCMSSTVVAVGRLSYVCCWASCVLARPSRIPPESHKKFTRMSPDVHQNSPEFPRNFAINSPEYRIGADLKRGYNHNSAFPQ